MKTESTEVVVIYESYEDMVGTKYRGRIISAGGGTYVNMTSGKLTPEEAHSATATLCEKNSYTVTDTIDHIKG